MRVVSTRTKGLSVTQLELAGGLPVSYLLLISQKADELLGDMDISMKNPILRGRLGPVWELHPSLWNLRSVLPG
jgi:hypothetical protein